MQHIQFGISYAHPVSNKFTDYPSKRSKRFCGVWKQRKTEGRDFWCFVCVENGARAQNPTETLAMQAMITLNP